MMNNPNNSPEANSGSVTENASQQRKSLSVPLLSRLGVRQKATLFAVAIGTLPLIAIGATAYHFANQSITKQITQVETEEAVSVAEKLNNFIFERYGDVQVLSNLPILINPKVRAVTTAEEKNTVLTKAVETYRVYDSIAAFDLKGNVLVQSKGKALDNHSDRAYFQQVIKTGQPVISEVSTSKSTGEKVIHFAAPIKERGTGQIIGVIRSRLPMKSLAAIIINSNAGQEELHIVDRSGKFIIATEENQVGRDATSDFPSLAQLKTAGKPDATLSIDKIDNAEQLIAYAPFQKLEGMPQLKWDSVVAIDTAIAFAPQRQLLITLALGTLLAALAVSAIAAYVANLATRPILESTAAVKKLGRGEFDTRIAVQGADEISELGSNINLMADQIQTLLTEQEQAATREIATQTQIAEEQKQRNEQLQQELFKLLTDVEGASQGNLTVRAEITAGEIGIVADFFNSIVESLRELVTQVQESATQVNSSVGENESAIRLLTDEALKQATQITQTVDSVEQMTRSIQQVADNAKTTAEVARTASEVAQSGGETMDRTVESILQLRETVSETAKKVKRLGEASQQISKVISLINEIALKTNLLAVNASIEAARAGEEGRGFAVVAEEVGQLAAQSAAATKEIEQIVETIQLETTEVVQAMELGTTQVVAGTRLVEETKHSLTKIVKVSAKIDQLVASISNATVSQAQTSQSVTQLMAEIAQISERTSGSSRQVSHALQKTVEITKKLQESVGTFKVA
ncbi:methyl-accepting chemotaxis protein [Merismopedia glauca]|uniref:Methyl-accepting chemotaxis protein n=1 Tax=Merismopedia glauca CCAP 1448/3 TaxID=1296344 RepID=A0A2T1C3Z4_9CYAN|nr:methyl-accepting chemotaxis protein [Merismopedia glauca]PSB02976.1 methyl-accepting chemotaxis protein [Merismopedia glauca CCAP 1448/3]